MIPIVIFDRGRPRIGSPALLKTETYRRYRESIDSVGQYAEIVKRLEAAVHDPTLRLAIGLDFAPEADYARRFISTTGLGRTKPLGSPERRLADRAMRLVIYLLCGGPRPAGRPIGRRAGPEEVKHVIDAHAAWLRLLRPLWLACGSDRRRIPGAVALASPDRLGWTAAHHHELARLARRRSTRPSTVATQLTAWELGLSVHAVRRLRRAVPSTVMHA